MRLKKILFIILAILSLTAVLTGCAGNGGDRKVVYENMKTAFEKADLFSANIGIFTKTERDGLISYGEGGSGVIFEKKMVHITL